ncbi:MAG: hypothetical protein ACRDRR_02125 [Pseudonocardiaceae bacterium]
MDHTTVPEQIARLWDQYVDASKQYQLAKYVVDKAEAVCNAAYNACEAAYADEVSAGRAVMRASAALQAVSDAAFLTENGISPELSSRLS